MKLRFDFYGKFTKIDKQAGVYVVMQLEESLDLKQTPSQIAVEGKARCGAVTVRTEQQFIWRYILT
jgi:hypothetical protein